MMWLWLAAQSLTGTRSISEGSLRAVCSAAFSEWCRDTKGGIEAGGINAQPAKAGTTDTKQRSMQLHGKRRVPITCSGLFSTN